MVVDFRKLRVWSEAHLLTLDLIKLTRDFPDHEKFGLISQINRCVASIPTNIVEACGQSTTPSAKRFLNISLGSLKELEYHILLARDLGYLSADVHDCCQNRLQVIGKMLYAFRSKLVKL